MSCSSNDLETDFEESWPRYVHKQNKLRSEKITTPRMNTIVLQMLPQQGFLNKTKDERRKPSTESSLRRRVLNKKGRLILEASNSSNRLHQSKDSMNKSRSKQKSNLDLSEENFLAVMISETKRLRQLLRSNMNLKEA